LEVVPLSGNEARFDLKLEPPVSVRLVSYTPDAPGLVAASARVTVSKKSLEGALRLKEEEVELWIRELIRRGHGSPLEHATYTFEVVCSRVCSHQLVRHRHASYTQHSMRHSEGFLRRMVLELCEHLDRSCPERPRSPPDFTVYAETLREAAETLDTRLLASAASKGYVIPPSLLADEHALRTLAATYVLATAAYYSMLSRGVRMEDARFLIPQAVRTRIVVTMNARELLEVFLPLRMCSRAQWELRLVAWMIREALASVHPEIFKYAGPRCLLEHNRTAEPCTLEDLLHGSCTPAIARCPELVPQKAVRSCLAAAARQYATLARKGQTRQPYERNRYNRLLQ
jgi:thymidylate synthase (FAD)